MSKQTLQSALGWAAIWAGSIIVIMFALPNLVFAQTQHIYECSDFGTHGSDPGWSCTADVITLTDNGDDYGYDSTPVFSLESQSVWYVTADLSGSGTTYIGCSADSGSASQPVQQSSSFVDAALNIGTCAGHVGLYIQASGSFQGTISNLCVATGQNLCSGGGGSTATSTEGTVDNAIDALFYGFILFAIGFWGIIWFFRRRNS